jgi:Fe-S cluster assembly scaffold protein SufB
MITTNSLTPKHIQWHDVVVDIIHGVSWKKTITLEQWAMLDYLLIVHWETDIDVEVNSTGPETEVTIHVLCLGSASHTLSCTVLGKLQHDNTAANIHMVTFLPEWSNCTINGNVTIVPGIVKASGHLLEENIILGDKIQIKTLPMLDVQSNDVSASHGACIEKIDAKKLFYAQSRGLDESQAKGLIIGGYFDVLFGGVESKISDMAMKGQLEALKHNFMRVVVG